MESEAEHCRTRRRRSRVLEDTVKIVVVIEPSVGCDILATYPDWDSSDGERFVLAGFDAPPVECSSAARSVSMTFSFQVSQTTANKATAWAEEQGLSQTKAYRQLFARGHFTLDHRTLDE